MKPPLSVPIESSTTRQLNVCFISPTLFFVMNSFDPLPFDRLTPSMPTGKLVFVSESVTPWHDCLEIRGPVPARIPDPTEKMAFLGGYTSPAHGPHCLSVLPLFWSLLVIIQMVITHFFFPVSEFIFHDFSVPSWNLVFWVEKLKS